MAKLVFMFACIFGLSSFVFGEDSRKDCKLPDDVPAEVRADDFRLIREDFARLYEAFCHEALEADKIKIRDVEYCAVKGGHALVFDAKLQGGNSIRFACLRDGTFAIRKGTEVVNMEFDANSGYGFFMPSAGELVYEIADNAFVVSLSGEGCLVLSH